MAGIAGKLLRVKIGDKYLRCQLDATLDFTNTFEEDEACKPEVTGSVPAGTWVERDASEATQDWSISVSARAFLDVLEGDSLHQGDIMALIVDGDLSVEVEFLSTPGQHSHAADMLFEGTGLIENFSLSAPVTGKATYDLDIVSAGKPTITNIPVTP